LVIVYFTVLGNSGTSQIGFSRSLINGGNITVIPTPGIITFVPQPSTLSLPNVQGAPGSTISVDLTAPTTNGVRGMDFWIAFNSSVITPVSATLSTSLAGLGFQMQKNLGDVGYVKLSIAAPGPKNISGTIATITFNIVGSVGATSSLSFNKIVINEGETSPTVQAGSVKVVAAGLPPYFSPLIGNKSVRKGKPLAFTIHGLDPEGGVVTYSAIYLPSGATLNSSTGEFSWTPNATGSYSMTFKVTDPTGLYAIETITINVTANNRPVMNALPTLVYNVNVGQRLEFVVSASDPDGDALTYFSPDLPVLANLNASSGSFYWVPQTPGTYQINFQASDGKNDSAPLTVTVNVTSIPPPVINRPPVFVPIPNQTASEGKPLQISLSASDPDNDPLTFSAVGLPTGASLNPATGLFSWTPAKGTQGNFPVIFTVNDGRGGTAEMTVIITVGKVNNPPVLSALSDQVVTELETLLINITVSDPDPHDKVQLTVEPLLAGAIFTFDAKSNTGQFRFVPALGQAGVFQITFFATDGKLTVSKSITITVKSASVPPVLAPIGNKTVKIGETLTFPVTAYDPTSRRAVSITMTGQPVGATLDPVKGFFTFKPAAEQAGVYTITITATNTAGLSVSETFKITVVGVNRPPKFDPVPPQSISTGGLLELTIKASDPDNDKITLSAAGVPLETLGATFNSTTGAFRWQPGAQVSGNFRVVFTVIDGKGGRDELAVNISVGAVNHPPVLSTLPDKSVNAGEKLSFTFTASDPDGDHLTLTVTNQPSGAVTTFTAGEGTFTWTPTSAQAGTYKISFVVRDKSLTTEKSFTITVLTVNRPPVISQISDRVIIEGEQLTFSVTASDPDNDPIVISASNLPGNASFDPQTHVFSFKPDFTQAGTYTVNFTASDPGGLTASAAVKIEVRNFNRPPKFGELNNQTVEVGNFLEFMVSATDPDNDTLTFTVKIPEGAVFDPVTGKFTWTPRTRMQVHARRALR
jgi:hypothetical protein